MNIFTNQRTRELVDYAEEHRKTLQRNEAEYRQEIRRLENQIARMQQENTRSLSKLRQQEGKKFSQQELLKLKNKKEIEEKERELKENEERCLEEIREQLKQLEIVQDEIRAGKKLVSEVMKNEETFRNVHAQLIEISRLWLAVMEEHEPIILMESIDEKGKEMFEVIVAVLRDMRARKQEMNDHCNNKCAVLVRANRPLLGQQNVQKILDLLEKAGKPFGCLDELISQAEKQKFGNVSKLEAEVCDVAKWVRDLENIRPVPQLTSLQVLDQKFKALAL